MSTASPFICAGCGGVDVTNFSVPVVHISSETNPLIKELHKLSSNSAGYRKLGKVWLEGDHLCRAALARGLRPELAVFSESLWPMVPVFIAQAAMKNIVVADALLPKISTLESPAPMGFVMTLPPQPLLAASAPSVILDRVQDAGNVGSILRSAAAFGFTQVLALKGCAALWSPKVLRAGMGAHFGLQLSEGLSVEDLAALAVPLVVTSSHLGVDLHRLAVPMPCAWVMGHEGQGVCDALMAKAAVHVRIDQPGGEESLNVAAAAAICLYASASSASAG